MNFTEIFIRRPVFASVLSLIILLVGIRSYFALPVRQYPAIEASVVTVTTTYPGASPKLMEGFVSSPLENSLSGVEGIDFMTSSNTQGSSIITVYFRLGYDISKGITDISNQVASVRNKLPSNINDPIIAKQDPNAQPTMYIAFLSQKITPEGISDYLARVVQPQIATLDGVAKVDIYGRPYAMRIWLDPHRMAALSITPEDVQKALANNNVQSAAGRIQGKNVELDITAVTDLETAEEFNNLVLKDENGFLVRIKDIGHAELGSANDRTSAFVNGQQTVILAVTPQPTANPLHVAKQVNHILPKIAQESLPDIKLQLLYDASKFIQQSIHEVGITILEATLCVIIVIFIFLGNIRAVLIPVITIPLSIIGVCGLMLAMGYSLNTLTLLAWVLAIGLVVDDAIVVLENIHRHMEDGMSALDAALIGAKEISFAVIAMTLTLAAVYAPIGFTSGLTGILFREFSFTLASAVIISGFVALTLSPMMCSKILHNTILNNKNDLSHRIDALFNSLMNRYKALLSKILQKPSIIAIVAGIIYLSCYFLYITLPNELAPPEDQGYLLVVASGPTSANLAYTEKYTQEIAKVFGTIPERTGYGIINGFTNVNSAISFLVFSPWEKRHRSVDAIIQSMFINILSIPGILAFPINPPSLPGVSGMDMPVEFVLKTTASYTVLNDAMQKLLNAVRENNKLLNIDTNLKMDKPQVVIDINRNKAGDLGISMNAIATALNLLFGQPAASRFIMSGRSYDVIPQLYLPFMDNAEKINMIELRTRSGQLTPLSNIIHIHETIAPQSLEHFQQQRAATLTASLAPGYTLGQALNYLDKKAQSILSDTIQIDYAGQSRQLVQASGTMLATFLFAIIFIFLVLAAQFESFSDPLVIMTSVLLSLSGALFFMHFTHCTMNIFTQIGLITLVGLISKHGILIVEFSNQLCQAGQKRFTAVVEAAAMRLRPILMTTAAMVLGAIPLALASGAGAESRRQIGWVIVGGMSIGTLLTLFIVPTAYLLLPDFFAHITKRFQPVRELFVSYWHKIKKSPTNEN